MWSSEELERRDYELSRDCLTSDKLFVTLFYAKSKNIHRHGSTTRLGGCPSRGKEGVNCFGVGKRCEPKWPPSVSGKSAFMRFPIRSFLHTWPSSDPEPDDLLYIHLPYQFNQVRYLFVGFQRTHHFERLLASETSDIGGISGLAGDPQNQPAPPLQPTLASDHPLAKQNIKALNCNRKQVRGKLTLPLLDLLILGGSLNRP